MSNEDVRRWRDRAQTCRDLAAGARHQSDREMLEQMADELHAEADRLEGAMPVSEDDPAD